MQMRELSKIELRELKQNISDVLSRMDDGELIDMWNEYQDCTCGSAQIHYMEDMAIEFDGWSIEELIELGCQNKFDISDDYFYYEDEGGYGYVSFHCLSDVIRFDDLADYIVEEEEPFGDSEIQELFEEYYNEEDSYAID